MPLYCDHPLPIPDIATKPKLQVTASNLRKPRSHLHLAPAAIALYALPAAFPFNLPLLVDTLVGGDLSILMIR